MATDTTTDEIAEAVAEAGYDWHTMSDDQQAVVHEVFFQGYDVTDYPHLLDGDDFADWKAAEDRRDAEAAEAAAKTDDLDAVRRQLRRDGFTADQIDAEMATAVHGTFGGEVAVETRSRVLLMGRTA